MGAAAWCRAPAHRQPPAAVLLALLDPAPALPARPAPQLTAHLRPRPHTSLPPPPPTPPPPGAHAPPPRRAVHGHLRAAALPGHRWAPPPVAGPAGGLPRRRHVHRGQDTAAPRKRLAAGDCAAAGMPLTCGSTDDPQPPTPYPPHPTQPPPPCRVLRSRLGVRCAAAGAAQRGARAGADLAAAPADGARPRAPPDSCGCCCAAHPQGTRSLAHADPTISTAAPTPTAQPPPLTHTHTHTRTLLRRPLTPPRACCTCISTRPRSSIAT